MGQEDKITEVADNGMRITRKTGDENGVDEMIEKAQDKTREVVKEFFSDEARKYYLDGKKGKKRERAEERFDDYEKEIQGQLKKSGTNLNDPEVVEQVVAEFLKKKRASAVLMAIKNCKTPATKKPSLHREAKGGERKTSGINSFKGKKRETRAEEKEKMRRKFVELFGDPDKGDFYGDDGGVVVGNDKHEFRVILVEGRADIGRVYVRMGGKEFHLTEKDKAKGRERTEVDMKEFKDRCEKDGLKPMPVTEEAKNPDKNGQKNKNKQELEYFPTTLREFDEGYKRAVMKKDKFIRDGVYVNQKDNSVLEIYFYNPNNGKVEIYQGAIKKREGKKGENIFDMPDRRGKDPEEISRVSFGEFKDLMKDYEYVSGNKKSGKEERKKPGSVATKTLMTDIATSSEGKKEGDLEDDIENRINTSKRDKPDEEDDSVDSIGDDGIKLPFGGRRKKEVKEYKEGLEEASKNSRETIRYDEEQKVEINKNILGKSLKEEIKTKEQFEEKFYPVGTTIEDRDNNFFMKIMDVKVDLNGFLKIQTGGGKIKGNRKNNEPKISWISVSSFNKIYDREDAIWEVKGNRGKEEQGNKKEEEVEFTEEEKKYIEKQLFPFFNEEMQRIDKWLEYYKNAGYEVDVLEGMKKEQKKILLKGIEKKLKETSSKNGLLKGKIQKLIEDLASK